MACLAVAVFAPTSARAGCDYPTHIEHRSTDNGDISASSQSEAPMPGQPCSCTGPTCSQQPIAPITPFSIEAVKISQWGRLIPRVDLVSGQTESCIYDEPVRLPARHPSDIYRPPRLLTEALAPTTR